MSKRAFGIVLLWLVSEVLGWMLGDAFHRLFLSSLPASAASTLNLGAARVMFTVYGLIAGLGIFVWALIAALMGPLFLFGARRPAPPPARPGSSLPPAK